MWRGQGDCIPPPALLLVVHVGLGGQRLAPRLTGIRGPHPCDHLILTIRFDRFFKSNAMHKHNPFNKRQLAFQWGASSDSNCSSWAWSRRRRSSHASGKLMALPRAPMRCRAQCAPCMYLLCYMYKGQRLPYTYP